ncbi:MAG: endonuclease domain-containing protein [Caulobacter sp.]|nr:endonuclease domain-containing protein [Caulobacter sp.]
MSSTLQSVAFARRLRKSMTRSEVALWSALRGKRLAGLRFRRQHPLGPFVVDFYCAAQRLAVEVDGAVHGTERVSEGDAERDQWIEKSGVRIVRIPDALVLNDMDAALRLIGAAAGIART